MSLELRNVGRTFNDKAAVRNISFTAQPGEIIGLLGTSGCGKSTVLRAISGLDDAYDGRIEFNGKAPGAVRNAIGFIFQEPRLMPWLTVLENVTFGLKGTRAEKESKGKTFLENVGLAGNENAYPKELSGGMAQRAAIARALVTSPEVLLLDEPFSALDAFTKMQLQDLLLDIWKTYQTTIVLVTHDIDEATYLCDRIITLRGQPGEMEREIAINEARPRTRGSGELAEYKKEILDSLDLNQPAAAEK
ncbi:ABC transporter ATP-binding protein [Salinicoccus sp. ID82-1]|uniref:ABC transporter ATP-binding protein n=1 Tax=Salinicoccus cyprini TaxID=2493691 RepID=A0A558ATP1_9STAP|nr:MULTISPECIES: ABC transporter ATP-binding protein [Salinicoccus]MCG1010888.1 ABC transporter ATP-binding protein [Salinicoccus sp. ID82-1]TVT27637.1 ABC transporter ATP-binding protein [Salinicoccus cyprini]